MGSYKPYEPPDGPADNVHWVFKQSGSPSLALELRTDGYSPDEIESRRFEMALYIINFMIFRETLFPASAPDANFNILFDLYISEQRCEQVSVTNICTAARVPQTTALRALQNLIDEERSCGSPTGTTSGVNWSPLPTGRGGKSNFISIVCCKLGTAESLSSGRIAGLPVPVEPSVRPESRRGRRVRLTF